MNLTMNRHDSLSSLSAIVLVLSILGAIGIIIFSVMHASIEIVIYGVAGGFSGFLLSVVLEWMRSVYVALYNLNRLAQNSPTTIKQE